MTQEQARFFENATDYCGNQEIDVRDNYSGRCMYGRTTYAIVVSSLTTLLRDVIQYMKENADVTEILVDKGDTVRLMDTVPDMDDFRTDNMARDIVIY